MDQPVQFCLFKSIRFKLHIDALVRKACYLKTDFNLKIPRFNLVDNLICTGNYYILEAGLVSPLIHFCGGHLATLKHLATLNKTLF